uniref:Triadin n=1 Tax=Seriola dumerili TaxID=41447 RepID=A0A3B4U8P9_SERDU
MSSQTNAGEAVPSARGNERTFLDDVILTFTSPMAWLLVVALIITWSGVAIVLFDLLDYKTLAGLPPPAAIAKRGLKARGKKKRLSRHTFHSHTHSFILTLNVYVCACVCACACVSSNSCIRVKQIINLHIHFIYTVYSLTIFNTCYL